MCWLSASIFVTTKILHMKRFSETLDVIKKKTNGECDTMGTIQPPYTSIDKCLTLSLSLTVLVKPVEALN